MLTHAGGSQRPENLNLWLHIWENVAMGAAIELRSDFDVATLRRLARTPTNANQVRRLLALAEIYDGRSRSDAARIGGVGLQIVRDWVVRFNTLGPDGLINGKAPGRRPKLIDAQREALVDSLRQKSLFAGFPFDQLYATVLDAYRNIIHGFIGRPRTA